MNRILRIAMIAPISERVPPKRYGGTERVIAALTNELVKKGHDVTLFASGDSITSAKLHSIYPRAIREARIADPYGLNEWVLLHIATAYKQEKSFDIIHDHNSIISLPTAQLALTPTVITIHGVITPNNRRLYEAVTTPFFVTISKAQTQYVPLLPVASVIPHGLAMESYPFCPHHKGYLLFVGRLSMDKGAHHAIDVAVYLNLPLILAAKLDKEDIKYFKEFIEPRLSEEQVTWIGEVDENKRNALMSEAMCLLHPVMFREPFGLTMIEAMACGCPVIAFNRGSIPEVIENGKTGFVVNDIEDMIEAVEKIQDIDRNYCREYALKHFNASIMANRYEELYYKILTNS